MNNYTAIVNLTSDPDDLKLGDRDVKKLRLADNTFGKNNETLFLDAIVSSGPDMEVAGRLAKGDQIVVTGTLVLGSYTAKKNTKYSKKGQKVQTHSIPFARILQVTKSETFFNGGAADGGEFPPKDEEGSTDAPDLTEGNGDDPMEGVV